MVFVVFETFLPALIYADEITSLSSPIPTTTIVTGDVEAISTSLSEVNTTTIDSQIEVSTISVSEPSQVAIPFSLGNEVESTQTATQQQVEEIKNVETEIINTAEAIASTGNNEQIAASASALTLTGDAKAMASAVSVANTMMVESEIEVGVVFVTETWYGDIVIDPVNWELDRGSGTDNLSATNRGTSVYTIATSSAETGNNTQVASDSATMSTGEGSTISQSNAVVNATFINADIFNFLPENIWLWSGNILNWGNPGSIIQGQAISNMSSQNDACDDPQCLVHTTTQNEQTQVQTVAIANATSGDNTQVSSGSATMTTGNAYAGAVATSIVNSTLINSRYRQLSLLLFAPWTGNLVFAYPDLGIKMSAPTQVYEGEEIVYQVMTTNYGYGQAKNVTLEAKAINSESMIYETNDSWETQLAGSEVLKIFSVKTDGKAGQIVTMKASVENKLAEESNENNYAEQITQVLPRTTANQNIANPKLNLSSRNNIHEYVYPGDQVTYDMTVFNDGPVNLKNIVLVQHFYTPDGEKISQFVGKVGNLSINGRKNIHFVMRVSDQLAAGNYYTESYAEGVSEQERDVNSNMVSNDLVLRLKGMAGVLPETTVEAAEALSPAQEQVLGMAMKPRSCGECLAFPWYIAISLGSLIYYLICRRQDDYAKAVRYGMALPLSAYAGLIMSNQQCATGIIMLPSASVWCQWFLPIAYAIYFGVCLLHRNSTSRAVALS